MEDDPTPNTHVKHSLRIYQINCNKSNTAQSHIINLSPADWDIIAIQEPYIDFQNLSRTTTLWRIVYPYNHSTTATSRTILLISKSLSTDSWEAIPVSSPDITAVQISGEFGKLRLFNVYNACEHSKTLDKLDEYLSQANPNANDTSPHL